MLDYFARAKGRNCSENIATLCQGHGHSAPVHIAHEPKDNAGIKVI